MTLDDHAAAMMLALSRLDPQSEQERAGLIGAFAASRAMATALWELPLGDLAPLSSPPHDGS